jgi:hypothetical protein
MRGSAVDSFHTAVACLHWHCANICGCFVLLRVSYHHCWFLNPIRDERPCASFSGGGCNRNVTVAVQSCDHRHCPSDRRWGVWFTRFYPTISLLYLVTPARYLPYITGFSLVGGITSQLWYVRVTRVTFCYIPASGGEAESPEMEPVPLTHRYASTWLRP